MARTAQLLTNPDAETATSAGWTAASNVLTVSGLGSFNVYAGARTFIAQNAGAFDFYQDVAIPGGSIAAVDAGMYAVDYYGYGARWEGSSTVTLTLKALDGVGAVLQTWSVTVSTIQRPYTELAVPLVTLPVGTRTVRAGWSGTSASGGDGHVYFESTGLYFEDVELAATKYVGYAVAADPPTLLVATKFNEYAVAGAGIGLTAAKFIAYGVIADGVATPPSHARVRLVTGRR